MIRTCANCGAKNHIPARHLADTGKCGKCKHALPPLSEPLEVDEKEFDEIVGTAPVPVFVDFWAAWCAPCRMAAPEVHKLAATTAGQAIVLKVDTEAHPSLAARFGVRGIPNFVVLRNGRITSQQAGVVRADTMRTWLEASHP